MRTKALASALILLGSTAALAQVADTQDAPVENNTQAEQAWDNSATTTEPVPAEETTPPAPTKEPTGEPSEDDLTTPPTDPTPPQG